MSETKKTSIVQMNINTSHYKPNTGRYRINLGQTIDFNNCTLSLVSSSFYNSTYNITQSYNNYKIGVKWIDGTIYQFTIDDGLYSQADLNEYLQSKMFENNLYAKITATGKPNYFIQIQENPVYYACQIVCSYVPNSDEASTLGYEKPTDATWDWPSDSITPQLLLMTEEMGTLLGFTDLVIPSTPIQDDNFEIVSPIAPRMSPVFNYLVNCNLLNNSIGMVGSNQLFYQVPVNREIGQILEFQPNFKLDFPCAGRYDYIELWLSDEQYRKLDYRDKDISVCLILEFQI